MDSSGSGKGPLAASCEHGNETSDSIKGGGICWLAEWLSASQEVLCSVGLVVLGAEMQTLLLSEYTVCRSQFQNRKDPRERGVGSFIFFPLSHPLRYFLSPELASLYLPRVLRCCHLRGPGIPTIHSHFADPFQGRGWVSMWRDGPVGILFSVSPLMRIVYSVSTGPKCDQCCQFSYCQPRFHCFRCPIGN